MATLNPLLSPHAAAAAAASAAPAPAPAPALPPPLLALLALLGFWRPPPAAAAAPGALRRSLTTFDLTMVGIGGIIGAGVYVLSGQAAAKFAGPAVVLSFLLAGAACFFCALCYAELAALIPAPGSAYSFATAALGPAAGFAVGWALLLEYLFGAATVAAGWSGYLCSLLADAGAPCSRALSAAPFARGDDGAWFATGGAVNLPAVAVVALATALQARGARESTAFNNVVVALKVGTLLLFLLSCTWYVRAENYAPFVPPAEGGRFGAVGVLRGAAVVFFAYIGFDAVSTAAAEALDPQRALPAATLASLLVCTALYIWVALVITGLVPFRALDVPDPIAVTVNAAGARLAWLRVPIKLGALLGLTSVVVVLVGGQARVLLAMAADGALPAALARVDAARGAPVVAALATGAAAALVAGALPVDVLGEMVSVGTLTAFVAVCASVLALRRTHAHAARPFRAPCAPATPVAGMALTLGLVAALPPVTLGQFAGWMAAGACVWWFYARRRAAPWPEKADAALGAPPGRARAGVGAGAGAAGGEEGAFESGALPTAGGAEWKAARAARGGRA